MEEKKEIPICHGEPMVPIQRYKEDGDIIVTYQCTMRHCNETVDVLVQKKEERGSYKVSRLFHHMWKNAGEDP